MFSSSSTGCKFGFAFLFNQSCFSSVKNSPFHNTKESCSSLVYFGIFLNEWVFLGKIKVQWWIIWYRTTIWNQTDFSKAELRFHSCTLNSATGIFARLPCTLSQLEYPVCTSLLPALVCPLLLTPGAVYLGGCWRICVTAISPCVCLGPWKVWGFDSPRWLVPVPLLWEQPMHGHIARKRRARPGEKQGTLLSWCRI